MICTPLRTLLVCIILVLSVSFAHAIDWVGDQDSSWITNSGGTNWFGDVIPAAGDDVTIDASLVGGGILFDFEEGAYRNLTIQDSTNSGTPLELRIDGSATTTATPGFGAANGLLLVKAGVGAVTVNQDPNAGNYGLNDSNITLEDGVLGDFRILAGSNRQRFHDFIGDGTITSTFTNNSDQVFNFHARDGDNFELTLHSDPGGNVGNFTFSQSTNPNINSLAVTGDALVQVNSDIGINSGSNLRSTVLSTDVTTVITNSSGTTRTLVLKAGDTTAAGKITGNLNLTLGFGSDQHLILSNDDTYTGTTTLGTGGANTNRSVALIREGSHVGGDDYLIVGGMRDSASNRQNVVLGGSGTIELQEGATMTLDRSGAAGYRARATLAPGNIGWDHSGVDSSNGNVGLLTAGNQGIGTLTVSADKVVFGDYSRLEVQLNGPNSDLLDILAGTGGNTNAGDLDLSSNLNELFIDADLLGDADGSTYTLLAWEGTRTGEFSTVWLQDQGTLLDITADALSGFMIDDIDYSLLYGADTLQLVGPNATAAVPEPASVAVWSLLGLVLAGFGVWRHRERNRISWRSLRWAALPVAVLVLALEHQPAGAAPVIYDFEADIVAGSTSATILGLNVPSGTITGTLSYDEDAAPNVTANLPFQGVWQNNLGAGQLSINVDGSTISTDVGKLDALAINFSGSYILVFGADIDASGGVSTEPNLLLVDGSPVANQATATLGFSTDVNLQAAGTLDFSLIPDTQWEGNSFLPGAFD